MDRGEGSAHPASRHEVNGPDDCRWRYHEYTSLAHSHIRRYGSLLPILPNAPALDLYFNVRVVDVKIGVFSKLETVGTMKFTAAASTVQ